MLHPQVKAVEDRLFSQGFTYIDSVKVDKYLIHHMFTMRAHKDRLSITIEEDTYLETTQWKVYAYVGEGRNLFESTITQYSVKDALEDFRDRVLSKCAFISNIVKSLV